MSRASVFAETLKAVDAIRPKSFVSEPPRDQGCIVAYVSDTGKPVVKIDGTPYISDWLAFAKWLNETFGPEVEF